MRRNGARSRTPENSTSTPPRSKSSTSTIAADLRCDPKSDDGHVVLGLHFTAEIRDGGKDRFDDRARRQLLRVEHNLRQPFGAELPTAKVGRFEDPVRAEHVD